MGRGPQRSADGEGRECRGTPRDRYPCRSDCRRTAGALPARRRVRLQPSPDALTGSSASSAVPGTVTTRAVAAGCRRRGTVKEARAPRATTKTPIPKTPKLPDGLAGAGGLALLFGSQGIQPCVCHRRESETHPHAGDDEGCDQHGVGPVGVARQAEPRQAAGLEQPSRADERPTSDAVGWAPAMGATSIGVMLRGRNARPVSGRGRRPCRPATLSPSRPSDERSAAPRSVMTPRPRGTQSGAPLARGDRTDRRTHCQGAPGRHDAHVGGPLCRCLHSLTDERPMRQPEEGWAPVRRSVRPLAANPRAPDRRRQAPGAPAARRR